MNQFLVKSALVAGGVSAIMVLGYYAEKWGFVGGEQQSTRRQQRPSQMQSAGEEQFDEKTFLDSFIVFVNDIQQMLDSPRTINDPRELEQMFVVVARTYTQVKNVAGMLDNIVDPSLQEKKVFAVRKLQVLLASLEKYRNNLVERGQEFEREKNSARQIEDGEEEEEEELLEEVEDDDAAAAHEDDEEKSASHKEEDVDDEQESESSHTGLDLRTSEEPVLTNEESVNVGQLIMQALAQELEQEREQFEEEQHREEPHIIVPSNDTVQEDEEEPQVQELSVD